MHTASDVTVVTRKCVIRVTDGGVRTAIGHAKDYRNEDKQVKRRNERLEALQRNFKGVHGRVVDICKLVMVGWVSFADGVTTTTRCRHPAISP